MKRFMPKYTAEQHQKIQAIAQGMLDAFYDQTERDPGDLNTFENDGMQFTVHGEFDGLKIAEAVLREIEAC